MDIETHLLFISDKEQNDADAQGSMAYIYETFRGFVYNVIFKKIHFFGAENAKTDELNGKGPKFDTRSKLGPIDDDQLDSNMAPAPQQCLFRYDSGF